MKVLLTGVSGQIGAHLAPRLRARGHEVLALDRRGLDLAHADRIAPIVRSLRPDLVINPAAYTAVDKAETDTAMAHAVNAEAPKQLALACAALSIPFIHFSTDYVFDGQASRPWRETDPTAPLGTYGATKLAGEQAIAQTGCRALILRTSWVYSKVGKNFLLTMQRLAAEKEFLRVVADQHGTPNWAGHLADAVTHVVGLGAQEIMQRAGVYHLTARGATTWHGFASAIVAAGQRRIPVHAITSAEFPTAAKRPAYSVLDGTAFEQAFAYPMPEWELSLAECLRSPAPA